MDHECPICNSEVSAWSRRCEAGGYEVRFSQPEPSLESNDLFDVLGGVGGFLFGFLGGLTGGIVSELAKGAEHYQEDTRMRRNIEEAIRNLE